MKIGLVLEGGGMRGIYTAGVLDFFVENKIDFDYCIGVSAGACNAVSFAAKQRKRQYYLYIDYIKDKRYLGLSSLIKTGDFLGTDFIFNELAYNLIPMDCEAFEKSKCKVKAVVTNAITGKAEYMPVENISNGCPVVQASSSLPIVSHFVEIDGKYYCDGGMSDSIPIKKSIDDGNEKNVIILTRDENYIKEPVNTFLMEKMYRQFPKLIDCIKQRHIVYNEQVRLVKELEAQGKAFVIRPQAPVNIGSLNRDVDKLKTLYFDGYQDARSRYDDLCGFLTNS